MFDIFLKVLVYAAGALAILEAELERHGYFYLAIFICCKLFLALNRIEVKQREQTEKLIDEINALNDEIASLSNQIEMSETARDKAELERLLG